MQWGLFLGKAGKGWSASIAYIKRREDVKEIPTEPTFLPPFICFFFPSSLLSYVSTKVNSQLLLIQGYLSNGTPSM